MGRIGCGSLDSINGVFLAVLIVLDLVIDEKQAKRSNKGSKEGGFLASACYK